MSSDSIFVSYSSKDRPFAVGFTEKLKQLGANVWIDQLGIKLGENWDNAIERALENSDTVMLLLSPTSVESPNVQDEVSIAIETEKKFVPILIKECDLPMRWQRRQYADLINNPEKAINDILTFLGLEEKAAEELKEVLKLIGVAEAPPKIIAEVKDDSSGKIRKKETDLEALLISNAEIEQARKMHEKGSKKNWQMIGIVGVISVALAAIVLSTNILTIDPQLAVGACMSLNLLSIKPFTGIKKRIRNKELLDLLSLKRERLIRVMNSLDTEEIEKFNNEFYTYLNV